MQCGQRMAEPRLKPAPALDPGLHHAEKELWVRARGKDQHPQTLMFSTCLLSKHAQQDRALTQTDRKIETEVAGLKTLLEAHKLDTIKYLAGELLHTQAFKTAGKNERAS